MKPPNRQILITCLAASCLFAQATNASAAPTRLPVSEWTCMGDQDEKFGPTVSGDSVSFSGEGFQDRGQSIAAFFPETTLTEGQSLTVTARVAFSGVHSFGLFKFGLFQSASKTEDANWVGYCAFAGSDKAFPKGGLFASEEGNKKYFGAQTEKIIAVDNVAHDAGNTILFWCGGIEVVAARNKSIRGGAIQQITISYQGQVLPGLRAQFFDNEILEGTTWGASFIFPRGSNIGTLTYPPISHDRTLQADKGLPVTAPDYHGPMALDQVFRRNAIANNGRFFVGGNVQNVLFEAGRVANSDIGIEVTTRGGRWADFLKGGPTDILARNNIFNNVTTPYAGDRLNETTILPGRINSTSRLPEPSQAGWNATNP